jgi:hypothetical protein
MHPPRASRILVAILGSFLTTWSDNERIHGTVSWRGDERRRSSPILPLAAEERASQSRSVKPFSRDGESFRQHPENIVRGFFFEAFEQGLKLNSGLPDSGEKRSC